MTSEQTTTTTLPPKKPEPRVPTVPGPRPMPLHMAVQTSTWLSSLAALTASNGALPPLRPELAERARGLEKALENVSPDAFRAAVERESRRRLDGFSAGVRLYQTAPRPPVPQEPPVLWQEGTTRLLDFGATALRPKGGNPDDRPIVLVIPSLVNRYWVLDLSDDHSLLRDLAARGLRPVVVDWDAPVGDERNFTLTDYVAGRLERALDYCCAVNGGPVAVAGYCMGGLLAVALAVRRPEAVAAMATLAAPWDFHAGYGDLVRLLEVMLPGLEFAIDTLGVLPVDMMQAMFSGLDPYATPAKFRHFATLDPTSEKAQRFVQLEDWLNDGVDLSGPVARECFRDWHLYNTPATGEWTVGGRAILPQEVTCPALVIVPERDHIVPPASSRALADALPEAKLLPLPAGHIGLVSGSNAPSTVFEPLANWLLETTGRRPK